MKRTSIYLFIAFCFGSLPAQTVTPHAKSDGLFYFQFANIYVEIDSTVGGRISSLKIDDQELLFENPNNSPFWGSSLWLSPQDGKHLPDEIDQDFYTGGIQSKEIVLSSSIAQEIPVSVVKKLRADTTDTSLTITYEIVNHGTSELSRAAWELTRVIPNGSLTFWPAGDSLYGSLASKVITEGDVCWYPFSPSDPSNGTKIFADSKDGWYGHVTEDNFLFVKTFTDVPLAEQAPGETEIEFWLSRDHQYIELENQSSYLKIAPNDTLRYTVKWYLRKLPSNIEVSVGSLPLVDYSRLVARIDSLPTKTRMVNSFSNSHDRGGVQPFISHGALRRGSGHVYTLQGVRVPTASTQNRKLGPGVYLLSNGSEPVLFRRGLVQ